MTPRVAVLTLTYNHERYIGQCIESVLAQTFRDWEMVIVDDASVDRTAEIVASFDDPRIKLIRLPHRGVYALADSYAAALAASSAPLLAILDGDDSWMPGKLARQVPLFDDPEVVMTFADVEMTDGGGASIGRTKLPSYVRGKRCGRKLIPRYLESRFYAMALTVVLRREALERAGGFVQPEGLPPDGPTWINVLQQGSVVGVPELLATYRVHAASICRTRTNEIEECWTRYTDAFVDAHGSRLGLSVRFLRSLHSRNDHRRAVAKANRGDWPGAVESFRRAFANGTPTRKLKTAVRYVMLAIDRHHTLQHVTHASR